MAQVRGSLSRILLRYPDLQLDKVRLVGWGAGQNFRDYYPMVKDQAPVEYTVCPNVENHGKTIHGVLVKSPQELMQEPHDEILVLIFAAHSPEIMQQIRYHYGDYRNIRAIDFTNRGPHLRELEALAPLVRDGAAFIKPKPAAGAAPAKVGIFLQGPVLDQTPLVLAHTRTKNPAAHLVFVTWKTESPEKIALCRPWVDDIVQLDLPEVVIYDTRNYLVTACRAGAEAMARAGVDYVVRSRSDVIVTGSIYECIDRLFEDGNRNKGRIAIHLGTSWAYIPFHFSEKVLISRTEDMVDLWKVPMDFRPASFFQMDHQNTHFLEFRHVSYENYVWTHYARSLGYAADTLEDAYRFARDKLVPFDKDLDVVGLKHYSLFEARFRPMFSPPLSWWDEMNRDFDSTMDRLSEIAASDMTSADFFQNRLG